MPDKEKSELEKAMQTAKKAAAGIPPEAMKAAAAAQQQAAEISPEAAQTAQEVQKVITVDAPESGDLVYTPEEFAAMLESFTQKSAETMQTLRTAFYSVIETLQPILSDDFAKALRASLSDIANSLLSVFDSAEWAEIESLFPGITTDDFFNAGEIIYNEYAAAEDETEAAGNDPKIDDFLAFFYALIDVKDFIPETLEAYKKESGADIEITFLQFVEPKDPVTGQPAESLFNRCRATAAEKRKEVPALLSIVPERYIMPNSIVSNAMTKGLVNAGRRQLDPSKGHKGKYFVYADISIDPNKYAVNGSFTRYDRRVLNGYCSLVAAGNTAFTAEMVFRAMNGLTGSEYVSPQQVAAVTKSLDKMRNIDIKIDATDEFKKRKIINPADNKAQVLFEAKCLEARIVTVKINGTERRGYQPLAKPVLYEYSERLNQVISVNSELLVIHDVEPGGKISKNRISNTDNLSLIREYLLQQIEIMKHNPKYNRTININTFYDETETNTSVSKYRTQARRQAAQCLDYWKAAAYIRDYSFAKKGKAIDGIKIIL